MASVPNSKQFLRCLSIVVFALTFSRTTDASEIRKADEPTYAQAILAFNENNFSLSQKLVKSLLNSYPDDLKLLELEALNLKGLGNLKASLKIYTQLASRVPLEGLYVFEKALLQMELSALSDSTINFLKSIDLNYNIEASNYFLGILALKEKTPTGFDEAYNHFLEAEKSDQTELKTLARYQLTSLAFQRQEFREALHWINLSRNSATESVTQQAALKKAPDPSILSIIDSLKKITSTLDVPDRYALILLQLGHDSNLYRAPQRTSTAMTLMDYALGYSSSPVQSWIYSAQLRGTANLNTNAATSIAQYFVNNLSLGMEQGTADSPNIFGVRLNTSYNFQKFYESENANGIYRPFGFTLGLNPYFAWNSLNTWTLTTQLNVQYAHDYSSTRTGPQYQLHIQALSKKKKRYWNPEYLLSLSRHFTRSAALRSWDYRLEMMNTTHLAETLSLQTGLNASWTEYPQNLAGNRHDLALGLELNGTWQITQMLLILSRFSFTQSASNFQSTYGYSRVFASIGAGYTF